MNEQFSQFAQQNEPGAYQAPFRKRSRAADFRRRAREALANRWLLAICAFLLASLLGAVVDGGSFGSGGNGFDSESISEVLPAGVAERIEVELKNGNFKNAVDLFLETDFGSIVGVVAVVALLISSMFSLFTLFVGAPVMVGYAKFNIDLIDRVPNLSINPLFSAFRACYWKAVGVRVLLNLISFAVSLTALIPAVFCMVAAFGALANPEGGVGLLLLSLLLLLAGCAVCVVLSIVVTYRYALCYFILAEYPTLGVLDVLRNSATLMKGNKWRLFCLEISFFGWILVTILTCGIAGFAVSPYIYAAEAAFYDELADRATARETEFPSLNPEDYFVSNQND